MASARRGGFILTLLALLGAGVTTAPAPAHPPQLSIRFYRVLYEGSGSSYDVQSSDEGGVAGHEPGRLPLEGGLHATGSPPSPGRPVGMTTSDGRL